MADEFFAMDGNMLSTMEIMALVLAKKEWKQIDVGIDLSLDNLGLLFCGSNSCFEEALLDCRRNRDNWSSTELVMRVFCIFACV